MLKNLLIALVGISLSIVSPAFAQQKTEQEQVAALAITLDAFKKPGAANTVWPNFRLDDSPAIVHFKNDHLYGFYLPQSFHWADQMVGEKPVKFLDHDAWGVSKIMMHPSFAIEGHKAFIFCLASNVDAQGLNLPLLTFVHERFHLHQFAHFNRAAEKYAKYSDEWNPENQELIAFEDWVLTQFLTEENASDEIRKEWLKDFLAVNVHRNKLLSSQSLAWEDLQQRMEGLADYSAVKAFETFNMLDTYSFESALLEMKNRKNGPEASLVDEAVKSRHYFVGAVLGLALDVCQADWKMQAEKGTPLRDLLAKALPLSEQALQQRFENISRTEEFKEISVAVRERLAKEKGQIDSHLQAYESAEGTAVHLGRPMQPISGGGRNLKTCHVHDLNLSLQDTSYSSSQDQQWRIRFNDVPFIFEDPQGGKTFKVTEETVMKIDDQEIAMNDLTEQRIPFKTLSWKEQHSEFATELAGSVSKTREGKIEIQFNR